MSRKTHSIEPGPLSDAWHSTAIECDRDSENNARIVQIRDGTILYCEAPLASPDSKRPEET